MKLTQSQRADLLAQFFISKATAALGLREKLDDAKEMLQAYEDELASWPELPPPVYGPDVRALADSFRSDVPVPLTEEQKRKVSNYPEAVKLKESLDDLTDKQKRVLGIHVAVRNPENIDFSKYPTPPGYTVVSEEDCKCPARNGWLLFEGGYWKPTHATSVVKSWTYLRPLRKDEK